MDNPTTEQEQASTPMETTASSSGDFFEDTYLGEPLDDKSTKATPSISWGVGDNIPTKWDAYFKHGVDDVPPGEYFMTTESSWREDSRYGDPGICIQGVIKSIPGRGVEQQAGKRVQVKLTLSELGYRHFIEGILKCRLGIKTAREAFERMADFVGLNLLVRVVEGRSGGRLFTNIVKRFS